MHDLAASPRRALAAPPKSHPKKIGAPKAKGAVRAKSGCYTCRIRRKKCDEQPNDEGRCQTCCRLRLQCLGFGQKRPDWLKNNNVTVFREKIKDFLAAQGMIKGHSGSGTRASDQEGMLVLVSESGRSDASSPHSPTLSASSSEDHRPRGLAVSDERTSQYPIMPMHHTQYTYPPIAADFPESREHMLPSTTELSLPFVAPPPSTIMPSNNSLASMSSCKTQYRY
ncbi:hypothetical protein FA95DRAFT_1381166 [Auriscalpium vulgare]|uniref:Uncharacterized protein n=1 Tax=Auriscalpium vulgare TaxID=40419 RepID=A0ACB8S818_9AGAM|nr:hypothetical protein FA95DRAFT_1381166 [Auriscalpium vulgare]